MSRNDVAGKAGTHVSLGVSRTPEVRADGGLVRKKYSYSERVGGSRKGGWVCLLKYLLQAVAAGSIHFNGVIRAQGESLRAARE